MKNEEKTLFAEFAKEQDGMRERTFIYLDMKGKFSYERINEKSSQGLKKEKVIRQFGNNTFMTPVIPTISESSNKNDRIPLVVLEYSEIDRDNPIVIDSFIPKSKSITYQKPLIPENTRSKIHRFNNEIVLSKFDNTQIKYENNVESHPVIKMDSSTPKTGMMFSIQNITITGNDAHNVRPLPMDNAIWDYKACEVSDLSVDSSLPNVKKLQYSNMQIGTDKITCSINIEIPSIYIDNRCACETFSDVLPMIKAVKTPRVEGLDNCISTNSTSTIAIPEISKSNILFCPHQVGNDLETVLLDDISISTIKSVPVREGSVSKFDYLYTDKKVDFDQLCSLHLPEISSYSFDIQEIDNCNLHRESIGPELLQVETVFNISVPKGNLNYYSLVNDQDISFDTIPTVSDYSIKMNAVDINTVDAYSIEEIPVISIYVENDIKESDLKIIVPNIVNKTTAKFVPQYTVSAPCFEASILPNKPKFDEKVVLDEKTLITHPMVGIPSVHIEGALSNASYEPDLNFEMQNFTLVYDAYTNTELKNTYDSFFVMPHNISSSVDNWIIADNNTSITHPIGWNKQDLIDKFEFLFTIADWKSRFEMEVYIPEECQVSYDTDVYTSNPTMLHSISEMATPTLPSQKSTKFKRPTFKLEIPSINPINISDAWNSLDGPSSIKRYLELL